MFLEFYKHNNFSEEKKDNFLRLTILIHPMHVPCSNEAHIIDFVILCSDKLVRRLRGTGETSREMCPHTAHVLRSLPSVTPLPTAASGLPDSQT